MSFQTTAVDSSITMRVLSVLILAAVAIESDSVVPRSRPNNLRRHLQRVDEFCGQCIWAGRIVCEGRAQFLVREYGVMTIEEARTSILNDCLVDGSQEVKLPLGAFCGKCPWAAMNFNCDSRIAYLQKTYYLSEEKAKEALLEKGECVNPDYVAQSENVIKIEDVEEPESLSTGAAVGITIAVMIVLMCILLCSFAIRQNRKIIDKTIENQTSQDSVVVEPPEPAPLQVAAPKKRKPRVKHRKTTVSFALGKPDPPGSTSNVAPDEYEIVSRNREESNTAAQRNFSGDAFVDTPITIEISDTTMGCTDESERASPDPENVTNYPWMDMKDMEEPVANDQGDAAAGMEVNSVEHVVKPQDIEDNASKEVDETQQVDLHNEVEMDQEEQVVASETTRAVMEADSNPTEDENDPKREEKSLGGVEGLDNDDPK